MKTSQMVQYDEPSGSLSWTSTNTILLYFHLFPREVEAFSLSDTVRKSGTAILKNTKHLKVLLYFLEK